MPLAVLYEDDLVLAVDKPRDIHVHPTKLSPREKSLQDMVEEERGFRPFPIHRLDRPVGGVLLLGKTPRAASVFGSFLRNREGLDKKYLAVVRGWMEGEGSINRPLRQHPSKPPREALTCWKALARGEAPWTDGRFPQSRYTLLALSPQTGRYHQLRRHLNSISHPIMGDIPHGDNPKNKIWREKTSLPGLMLQADSLSFIHPVKENRVTIKAPPDFRFSQAAALFDWPFP